MKKDLFIIALSSFIVMGTVMLAAASFRWYNAKDTYEEVVKEDADVPYSKVDKPVVGAKYFREKQFHVTYSRGTFPSIDKKRVLLSDKLMYYPPSKD